MRESSNQSQTCPVCCLFDSEAAPVRRLARFLSAVSHRCPFCSSERPPSQGRDVFFSRVPPFVYLSDPDLPSLIMLELKKGSFENGELRWNGTPFPFFSPFRPSQAYLVQMWRELLPQTPHTFSQTCSLLFSLSYSVPIAHRLLVRIPELFAVQSRHGGEYSAVLHCMNCRFVEVGVDSVRQYLVLVYNSILSLQFDESSQRHVWNSLVH